MGVLKTTLRVSDFLEGWTELGKATKLTVTVYYTERIWIEISRGRRQVGQSSGDTGHSFLLSSPSGFVQTVLNFPTSAV